MTESEHHYMIRSAIHGMMKTCFIILCLILSLCITCTSIDKNAKEEFNEVINNDRVNIYIMSEGDNVVIMANNEKFDMIKQSKQFKDYIKQLLLKQKKLTGHIFAEEGITYSLVIEVVNRCLEVGLKDLVFEGHLTNEK